MSRLDPAAPLGGSAVANLRRRLTDWMWRVEHAFERSKAEGRAVDDARLRIFLFLSLFSLVFAALAFEAGRAALFSHRAPDIEASAPPEARGDLVDRQGRLVAVDLPHYGLYVDPRDISPGHERQTRQELLNALPRLSADRLDRALASGRRQYLVGGLTPHERELVHDLGRPGVEFEEEPKRVYPLGATAAHLIGFSDASGKGLAGAERALDPAIKAAAPGLGQTALSIDLRVQGALEDELRRAVQAHQAIAGVGLVTDIRTGEVLAMSSLPDFDPNAPGAATPDALMNRAAASVYEMGSTFKVFTFAMGLDSGVATLNSTFDARQPVTIGNQTIHDYHAENKVMTLEDIFLHSSNIGTAKLGLAAGAGRMTRYFKAFGLLAPAPIELLESARPIAPRTWNENVVASAAFGHAISVSPLAVAAGMGAVLNGGVYVPLTVQKRPDGQVIAGRRVVSVKTSRAMLDLMRLNVIRGTGSKADALGLSVGGKTGSAEKAIGGHYVRDKLVSSFAAVFPTDGPMDAKRYLVLILLDEPKGTKETFGFATAGWTAAPTAGRVIDRIAPFLGVRRAAATPFAAPPAKAMPAEELSGGEF